MKVLPARLVAGLALFAGLAASCNEQSASDLDTFTVKARLMVGPPSGGPPVDEDADFVALQELERYVYPRAYPDTAPLQAKRAEAWDQLHLMRVAQGLTHYDPAGDTCGGTCTEEQACFSGFCAALCCQSCFPDPICPPGSSGTLGPTCFCVPTGTGTGGPDVPATGCGWHPLGPTNVSGRVNSLAFDPGDANRLFAGTVGGLWLSSSTPMKARAWRRIVTRGRALQVGPITFNATTRELFIGTGDPSRQYVGDGVWMSSNGETGTWTNISESNATLKGSLIYAMRAQPGANGNVYVATRSGLFVGSRTGATWSWALLGGMDAVIDDVEIDPTSNPPIVYAVARTAGPTRAAGVWVHNGSTWALRGGNITLHAIVDRARIALSPDRTTLYAAFQGRSSNPPIPAVTIWRSTNSGQNQDWSPVTDQGLVLPSGAFPFDPLHMILEIAPNGTLYIGSFTVYSLANGGSAWVNLMSGILPHPDQHALVFDPANDNIVYSGNDGGVHRGDASVPGMQWRPSSHGMVNSQFYRVASQPGNATFVAGGIQDEGSVLTFGNRTWFHPGWGDGLDVALDAVNSMEYVGVIGGLSVFTNPVPYSVGGLATVSSFAYVPATGVALASPTYLRPTLVATDPTITLHAIARGIVPRPSSTEPSPQPGQEFILKTTNVGQWSLSHTPPNNSRITAMAVSPCPRPGCESAGKYYYAASQDCPINPTTQQCTTSAQDAKIHVSANGGTSWSTFNTGTQWIKSIAIDPGTPTRAWISGRDGSIRRTTDGGATWLLLSAVDNAHKLPPSAAVTSLAAASNGTLYAGTNVGVFGGFPSGAQMMSWTTFDNGLPDGVDVMDIQFNAVAQTLNIGTWGHGAFRLDLTESECGGVKLVVRDTVYDLGREPSASGLPNPEWPVVIDANANPVFFKADDSDGGRVYFWESTDIRTEVPSIFDSKTNRCPGLMPGLPCPLDSSEFDSCPIGIKSCPSWLLTNEDPRGGVPTTFYVQVANQGLKVANNVRVITLLADASAGVPLLPSNFWTQFPPGTGTCGTVAAGSGWRLAGCKVLNQVTPLVPEVAEFTSTVPNPPAATEHQCMVAIVDAPDDAINASGNPLNVEVLAQASRHVAQRNLHVIGTGTPGSSGPGAGTSTALGIPFSGLTTIKAPNRWNASTASHQVMFWKGGLAPGGGLAFLLPAGKTAPNLPPKCGVAVNSASDIAVSMPKGVLLGTLALSANGSLDLADRAVVVLKSGAVANSGTGTLTVGVDGKVGPIWSIGNVFLRTGTTVAGNVTLGGTITTQSPVAIQGVVQQTTTLSPADVVGWGITWPATSRGNRDVQPGQQLTELPGRLGNVSVKGNATLRLTSGTYYIDALTFESQSTLLLDQANGPTLIYARQGFTFRGSDRTLTGAEPDLLVVATGSADVFVETAFTGSVVAPTARLTIGGNAGTFVGSYHGRDVVVRAGVTVDPRTSGAWSSIVPACRALTAAEKTAAQAAGLSPTLYPILGPELKQSLPIPLGQTWVLGVRYDSGVARTGTAGRFRVMSLSQNQVMAGSTFMLRQ